MEMLSLQRELAENTYTGERGTCSEDPADGRYAVTAYFIMGKSGNSRNRIFVEDQAGIRTEAFDPSRAGQIQV